MKHRYGIGMLLAAVAAVGLTACSNQQHAAPTSSDVAHESSAERTPVMGIPSSGLRIGTPAAGKLSFGLHGTAERTIGPEGGELKVRGADDFSYVSFKVPAGALDEPVLVGLSVSGFGGSLQAEFEPAGLHFKAPAVLTMIFPRFGLTREEISGYLLSDTGAEEVAADVKILGPWAKVRIYVSHFSIYAPSDGDDYSAMFDSYGGWWNSYGYEW